MITITLPYPPSANRYWRSYVPKGWTRALVVVSEEAKQFKANAGWRAKAAGIREPLQGLIAIELTLHPKLTAASRQRAKRDPNGWDEDAECIDLDNAVKVTLDALKGIAFEDDRRVFQLLARRGLPDGDGKLVVTIAPFVRQAPQPALFDDSSTRPTPTTQPLAAQPF